MKKLFVDTGFLLALEIKNDQNHIAAKNYWHQFKQSPYPLLTTTYVVDETATFLNSRGWHEKAVKVGQSLLNSPLVQTVHIDETLFWQGWQPFPLAS